ncbi:Asp-tRNA(Asn)/Glu-tRNA(Gln) amidotransferase GatCAB subunit A, partial [Candidatus Roizmanbacteria bacterium]|nr:Asp-tRNA(Asn)/Glu-tRNA(Gln) amidotransferase GatCAB subunit A [Candidatus Roizmanbacteria bacterium]
MITETINKIKEKKISAVELTQDYLSRIKRHNPTLNAFITVNEDGALRRAQELDK